MDEAGEAAKLREALRLSAERFDDMADIVARGGTISHSILAASAERIRRVLDGGGYHDDIHSAQYRAWRAEQTSAARLPGSAFSRNAFGRPPA